MREARVQHSYQLRYAQETRKAIKKTYSRQLSALFRIQISLKGKRRFITTALKFVLERALRKV
jgi:hypothetical protein